MPRDAVSRTANVERNGGHKWVNTKKRTSLPSLIHNWRLQPFFSFIYFLLLYLTFFYLFPFTLSYFLSTYFLSLHPKEVTPAHAARCLSISSLPFLAFVTEQKYQ